jgi:hypothetical protein
MSDPKEFILAESVIPALNATETARVSYVGMRQSILQFYTSALTSTALTGSFSQFPIQTPPYAMLKAGDKVQLWNDAGSDKVDVVLAKDMLPTDSIVFIQSVNIGATVLPVGTRLIYGDFLLQYISIIDRAIKLGVQSWEYIVDENDEILEDEFGNPLFSVEGDQDGRIKVAEAYIEVLLSEITLKVNKGEVNAEINLSVLENDLGDSESFIGLMADKLDINGLLTISNFDTLFAGTSATVRSDTAPTVRANGEPLRNGDIWIDTTGATTLPYTWNGTSWEVAFTKIDGAYIQTGTIDATKIAVDNLSALTASMGQLTVDELLTIAEGGKIYNAASFLIGDDGLWVHANNVYTSPSRVSTKDGIVLGRLTSGVVSGADPIDPIMLLYGYYKYSGTSALSPGTLLGKRLALHVGPDDISDPTAETSLGDLFVYLRDLNIFTNQDVSITGPLGNIFSYSSELPGIQLGDSSIPQLNIFDLYHLGTKVGFFGTTPVIQQSGIEPAAVETPNSGDANTDILIANLVDRVTDLEARLTAYGLLAP